MLEQSMHNAYWNSIFALILGISFVGLAMAADSGQTNNESAYLLETTQNLSANATNATYVIVLQGDSIQAAIESSSPGSIIEVHTGTYRENLNVTKRLTIHGVDDGVGLPVVDANENGSAITVSVDGVLLDNLTVVNSPLPSNEFEFVAGMNVTSSNCTIKNCLAYNNSFGLCLSNQSNNNTLAGNNVIDNKCGVALISSDNNILYANNMSNNEYGIMLGLSDKNDILENTILGNKYGTGIRLVSSQNNTLNGNNLSKNNYGINLGSSQNNTLNGNNLSNCKYGISLDSSQNNTLNSNNLSKNDYGISLDSSQNNTLNGNNLGNGVRGIILYSSRYNLLSNNSLYGNEYNFCMDGTSLSDFDNEINISNLVNGQPIYYLKDESNVTIDLSSNAGLVGCYNCTDIVVRNVNIANVETGICLYKTNHSIVESCNITNITYGIILYFSNNNKIRSNTISNGEYGIRLDSSQNNTLNGNNLSKDYYGINLKSSQNNTLNGNNLSKNNYGINLESSRNNTLNGNNLSNNMNGFIVSSSDNNALLENDVAGEGDGFGIEITYSKKIPLQAIA
ncbi:MAG: right-handed parallel beta-helix repeat-containing protein [Methanothrix sp.]|nr:right-handed parallel beta-helix repeat-containing protein [Methanothrix sp.]